MLKLKIEWTLENITLLFGSHVESQGETCILCWDQKGFSSRQTRVWLMSLKDGMLYHYGDSNAEAVAKLNVNGVTLLHKLLQVEVM